MATTTFKILYGNSGCAITLTAACMVNNGMQASASVDNTVDLWLDALVAVQIASGSVGVSATGIVNVYAYGTAGCAIYTDTATGTDAGITPASPTNLKLLQTVNVNANSTRYSAGPWSVAAAFGGVLPSKWGVAWENKSGSNLNGIAASHMLFFQGIQAQGV